MIVSRPDERATLRECGRRLAAVLEEIASAVRPGTATLELDERAARLIRQAGGEAVFRGYRTQKGDRPFPASICTSVNDEVVHGIPRRGRRLEDGDIIGLDVGMRWPASGGLVTDMAVTVPVGSALPQARLLISATREALRQGIAMLSAGVRLGDLGYAIQQVIEARGCSVIRDLVGHGVGHQLHEDPYVPNYGASGEGAVIRDGSVLAIEPMATLGGPAVGLDADGWTWRTRDGSLAAHFEHTVLVTKNGTEVLTKV